MKLFENYNEVAANVTLAFMAIAYRRLKADLFGLKVEKAHISGKLLPFVFAHQAPYYFLRVKSAVKTCSTIKYET